MYLIVGLGNPGEKYKYTRHNVGFVAIDYISARNNIKVKKIKFKALYGEGVLEGERVLLSKPSTFMNNSGESVRAIAAYYKIKPENIIVIYDDAALDIGKVRIRPSGSDGGHNGMKSIIYHLASDGFTRIRIGIGKGKNEMVGHVLGSFSAEEGVTVTACIKEAEAMVKEIIKNGVDAAMNIYNGKTY